MDLETGVRIPSDANRAPLIEPADLLDLGQEVLSPADIRRICTDDGVLWTADVYSPVHPEYMRLVTESAACYTRGYQLGAAAQSARQLFQREFGSSPDADDVIVLFAPTGTGANRLCTAPVLGPQTGLVTTRASHAFEREAGSVEHLHRARVMPIGDHDDKITVPALEQLLRDRGEKYWVRPTVVSISNPTENGLIYTPEEIRSIVSFAHAHGMFVQLDGARIFLACSQLGCTPRELTTECGVDIASVGGSKVGMFHAEAAVFLPSYFERIESRGEPRSASALWDWYRGFLKMNGELMAQSAPVAMQFIRAFTDDFGITVAAKAIAATKLLADGVESIPGCRAYLPVQSNVLLLSLPKCALEVVTDRYKHLSVYRDSDPDRPENVVVRFMGNHNITADEVEDTVRFLRRAIAAGSSIH